MSEAPPLLRAPVEVVEPDTATQYPSVILWLPYPQAMRSQNRHLFGPRLSEPRHAGRIRETAIAPLKPVLAAENGVLTPFLSIVALGT